MLGKIAKNELFILPMAEYLVGYLQFFLYKVNTGIIVLGICDRMEAAEDLLDVFRLYIKSE